MPCGGRRTMPPNNQRPATNTPASPRSTAKYTNKDGSKFITVPKAAGGQAASNASDPSAFSPLATPSSSNPSADADFDTEPAPTVNRKKQKRRQKAAAKAAAEQAANGHPAPAPATNKTHHADSIDADAAESDIEDDHDPRDHSEDVVLNGHSSHQLTSKGKKNKKKKKKGAANANEGSLHGEASSDSHTAQALMQRGPSFSRDKIWSTSNHEERERIKEFWLGLGEDERKSLVKVEKDAVLKKMKEQQKHTCSCTVCGRKRTAIEEELE